MVGLLYFSLNSLKIGIFVTAFIYLTCMKFTSSRLKSLVLLLSVLFIISVFSGCAATRKLDAASILSKTHLEFNSLALDSVSINPDLFDKLASVKTSLLPNPQVVTIVQNLARGIIESELGKAYLSADLNAISQSEDSLWVRSLNATLVLDSVMELPINLRDSVILVTGTNKITVTTSFPVDKRIFKLESIRKITVKGVLEVALDAEGPSVPLDFEVEKAVTPEEITALEDNARQTLLNGLINDWVGAILPKD